MRGILLLAYPAPNSLSATRHFGLARAKVSHSARIGSRFDKMKSARRISGPPGHRISTCSWRERDADADRTLPAWHRRRWETTIASLGSDK